MNTSKADKSEWVAKKAELTTSTAYGNLTIDISEYLPDDGAQYEVLLRLYVDSSKVVQVGIGSDIISPSYACACSNSGVNGLALTTIPVGAERFITRMIEINAPSHFKLTLVGYRKVN